MSYKKELDLIQEYIKNFKSDEFSSSSDFSTSASPSEEQLKRAGKIKARMNRKHLMAEAFVNQFRREDIRDNDVTISQEEIDALLDGNSKNDLFLGE